MDKKVVVVTWWDSQDHPDKWVDEVDAEAFNDVEVAVVSYGILVKQTDKYVTLAADWDPIDKDYGRVTKIPTKMIQSVVELLRSPAEG